MVAKIMGNGAGALLNSVKKNEHLTTKHDAYRLYQKLIESPKIIAIVYYGRSGSYFLNSLLDGHPQLITVPLGYLQTYYHSFWPNAKQTIDKEAVADKFCNEYEMFFDSTNDGATDSGLNCLGENRDQDVALDRNIFHSLMEEGITALNIKSRREFFIWVHTLFTQMTRKINLDANLTIIYQLHSPHPTRMKELINDFKDTRFLQVVREPLQTTGSHFKRASQNQEADNLLHLGHAEVNACVMGGYFRLRGYEDASRAIKLEDLHCEPKKTLEKLCHWLDIPWADCLLRSEVCGKQWWNVSGTHVLSGFNKKIISKNYFPQFYYRIDVIRLHVLLKKRYRKWHYYKVSIFTKGLLQILVIPLFLLPFKMEIISFRLLKEFKGKKKVKNIINFIKAYFLLRRYFLHAFVYNLTGYKKELDLL